MSLAVGLFYSSSDPRSPGLGMPSSCPALFQRVASLLLRPCVFIYLLSKAFANAYSFIFFIFLACWYLKYLVNPNKDKLCLIIYKSLFLSLTHLVSVLTVEKTV